MENASPDQKQHTKAEQNREFSRCHEVAKETFIFDPVVAQQDGFVVRCSGSRRVLRVAWRY